MEDLKNRILDKVKDRFERFGLKKTTMDEISRDCQISKKTIYEHFVNKEDVFSCLVTRELVTARKVIFSKVADEGDPVGKLIKIMTIAIQYFKEENFLTRFLQDDGMLIAPFLSMRYREQVEAEVISIIAEIIQEGKQQGQIRDVDERVIAYAGLKLLQAFSYMQTFPVDCQKNEQGYYSNVIIDLMLHGLLEKGC